MKLEPIADYASISDTSWTTGTTGNYTGIANTSWNCFYHHFTVANRQTDTVTHVMDPVRFSSDAPASDGGTYDWWYVAVTTAFAGLFPGFSFPFNFGLLAISKKVLATGSHGAPKDGWLQVTPLPTYQFGLSQEMFAFDTINAISANTPLSCAVRIAAIQHRVNGSASGGVIMSPGTPGHAGANWNVDIAVGDEYELDMWFELKYTANPRVSAIAGKCCVASLQTRVDNGSRRPSDTMNFVIKEHRPRIRFTNVDYSTAYNYTVHTYNITIAGHAGWTLKGGSNGPHKIETGGGWTAVFSSYGELSWQAPSSHDYVERIEMTWRREIPYLRIKVGTLLATALGWVDNGYLYYRPQNSSSYRQSTVATDHGATAITHSPCGVFTQGGTTTWILVPKSTSLGLNHLDGYRGLVSTVVEVPTTITTSRTTQ
jgi:hypothetical protein